MKNSIIICREEDVAKTKTRKAFLREYFAANCPATYEQDGTPQCEPNRNRSCSDLLMLVRSRFKATSEKALFRILGELCRDHGLFFVWCNQINKPVAHSAMRDSMKGKIMSDYSRRHSLNKEGVDGYTLAQIEKAIQKYS